MCRPPVQIVRAASLEAGKKFRDGRGVEAFSDTLGRRRLLNGMMLWRR
jgi:hypothetical protein